MFFYKWIWVNNSSWQLCLVWFLLQLNVNHINAVLVRDYSGFIKMSVFVCDVGLPKFNIWKIKGNKLKFQSLHYMKCSVNILTPRHKRIESWWRSLNEPMKDMSERKVWYAHTNNDIELQRRKNEERLWKWNKG